MLHSLWGFLWTNGVGQNLTASAVLAAVAVIAGWVTRGPIARLMDRFMDRHLDHRHEALHVKLDEILANQRDGRG